MKIVNLFVAGSALALAAGSASAQMPGEVRVPGGVMPAGTVISSDPADQLAFNLRVLAQNPRDVTALTQAGESALAVGDANAAIGFLARAEQLSPANGRIKASLGSALVMVERPTEALRLFNEAQALGVTDGSFARTRGLAYDLLGEQRRAQRDYAVALRNSADDETIRRMALSLGISGDREQALRMLEPLTRKQDQAAWRARSFILAMNGDVRGAERIAEQVAPPSMMGQLSQFLRRLASLTPAERASAVNFGTMPSDGTTRFASAGDDGSGFRPMTRNASDALAPSASAPLTQTAQADERSKRRDRRRPGRIRDTQIAVAPPPPPIAPSAPARAERSGPAWVATSAPRETATRPAVRSSGDAALLPSRPARVPEVVQASVGSPAPVFEVPPAQPPVVRESPRPSVAPSSLPTTTASPALSAASAPLRRVGPIAPPPAQQSLSGGQIGLAVRPAATADEPPKVPVQAMPSPVTPLPVTPSPAPAPASGSTPAPGSVAVVSSPAIASPAQVVAQTPAPVLAGPAPQVPAPVVTATPDPVMQAPAQLARAVPDVPAPAAPVSVPAPVPVPTPSAAPAPSFTFTPSPTPVPSLPASTAPTAVDSPLTPAPSPVSPAGPPVSAVSPPVISGPTLAEARVFQSPPAVAQPSIPAPAPTVEVVTLPQATTPPPAETSAPAGLGSIVAGLEVEAESAAAPVMTDAEFRRARLAARRRAEGEAAIQTAAKAQEEERRAELERERQEAARNPARIWVQVATGANRSGLPITWKRLREQAPDALKGMSASTAPFRATNRLLIGPFKSQGEARTMVNRLSRSGISATTFTSGAGDEVERVSSR